MGKEQSFPQMVLEQLVILHKKRNLNPYCILYIKRKPKWIIGLSVGAAAANSLQLCPTLCNPIDGSPPGSPIPGILQARTLEWVAISFSNAWKWKVKVKSLSRVRLFADGSPPGSPIPGILQARTLEWVDISFSNAWKWKVRVKSLSCVRLLATPWTAAYQAPLPMGFSRQGYCSG